MKASLHTLPGSGTPYGLGFYNTLLECQAKAAMVHAQGPDRFYGGSGKPGLDIGALFHAYQEIYRKHGHFETARVKITGQWEPKFITEATRLFKAYRLDLEPDYWGKIVAVEQATPNFWWDKKRKVWIVNSESGVIASEAVGAQGLPVTSRPDLIVKITAKDARRIKKFHGITIEPGYWMIDYKTAARFDGALFRYYELSLQFRLYPLIWNALHPKQKVKGVIADIITKERIPQFHAIKVPLSPRNAKRATSQYFETVRAAMSLGNWERRGNPSKCVHWRDGKCGFYTECKHRIT